jgi:hypothetical protein
MRLTKEVGGGPVMIWIPTPLKAAPKQTSVAHHPHSEQFDERKTGKSASCEGEPVVVETAARPGSKVVAVAMSNAGG